MANHSCNPNSLLETWTVGYVYNVAFVTEIPMLVGDEGLELTIDFGWTETDFCTAVDCLCGSDNCRGTLYIPRMDSDSESSGFEFNIDESSDTGSVTLGSHSS